MDPKYGNSYMIIFKSEEPEKNLESGVSDLPSASVDNITHEHIYYGDFSCDDIFLYKLVS